VDERLSRADLIRLVEQISASAGTEEEISQKLTLLERNVLDPEVSGYIFWPDRPMSAEEIVDRALAYSLDRMVHVPTTEVLGRDV
jgi:hypothetical protein